jgi:hypothetical protein
MGLSPIQNWKERKPRSHAGFVLVCRHFALSEGLCGRDRQCWLCVPRATAAARPPATRIATMATNATLSGKVSNMPSVHGSLGGGAAPGFSWDSAVGLDNRARAGN